MNYLLKSDYIKMLLWGYPTYFIVWRLIVNNTRYKPDTGILIGITLIISFLRLFLINYSRRRKHLKILKEMESQNKTV